MKRKLIEVCGFGLAAFVVLLFLAWSHWGLYFEPPKRDGRPPDMPVRGAKNGGGTSW